MVRRARRAVSPIIATLILVVVTVAIAVLFYLWLTGFFAAFMGGAGGFGSLTPTGVKQYFKTTGVFILGFRADMGDVILSNISRVVQPDDTEITVSFAGFLTSEPSDLSTLSTNSFYIYPETGMDDTTDLPRIPNGQTIKIYIRVSGSLSTGDWTIDIGVHSGGYPGPITVHVT